MDLSIFLRVNLFFFPHIMIIIIEQNREHTFVSAEHLVSSSFLFSCENCFCGQSLALLYLFIFVCCLCCWVYVKLRVNELSECCFPDY